MFNTRAYMAADHNVRLSDVPGWDFLYKVSTVRDSRWNVGDRVILPDSRVFRYARASTGGLQQEFGAVNPWKTIANAVVPAGYSTAIGASQVTITVGAGEGKAANGAIAQDELAGGYAIIANGANQHPENRGIIGNTVVAAGGGVCTVYLDGSLTQAVVASTTNVEVMHNPYLDCTSANVTNSAYVSVIGMPVVTTLVNQYAWLQTWGPCWVTSDSLTADDANDRIVYFAQNGSIKSKTDIGSATLFQPAGWCMDASSAGSSNAPVVYLQISS